MKLAAVNGFCLGFGDRANCRTSMPPDTYAGDGNVMFDNIRLYSQTCNPTFAHTNGGLTGDFDNDCDVDVNDLDRFVNSWLAQGRRLHLFSNNGACGTGSLVQI